jgi:hypothetical protein
MTLDPQSGPAKRLARGHCRLPRGSAGPRRFSHEIATMEHTRFGLGRCRDAGHGRPRPGTMGFPRYYWSIRFGLGNRDGLPNLAPRLQLNRWSGQWRSARHRRDIFARLWPGPRCEAADDHGVPAGLRCRRVGPRMERIGTSRSPQTLSPAPPVLSSVAADDPSQVGHQGYHADNDDLIPLPIHTRRKSWSAENCWEL